MPLRSCYVTIPKPSCPTLPNVPLTLSSSTLKKLLTSRTLMISVCTLLLLFVGTFNQELLLRSVLENRNDDTKFFNTRRNSRAGVRGLTPVSLNYYPKGGPAIVTLVTNLDKDIKELETALKSLAFLEGDNPNFPTPVLVFNEGDLSAAQIHTIVESSSDRPIAFPVAQLFTDFPEGYEDKDPVFPLSFNNRKKWGYYHMIKFWISDIWKHPALKPFEVIMRIDSDSCFKEPNHYLPFFAHEHLVYQSQYVGYEAERAKYIKGLYEFVRAYMSKHNIVPRNPMLWQFVASAHDASESLPVFQTNLEISHKSFMQRREVAKFHKAVTEEEPFGVFRYRWGDAVVRFVTVALFAEDGYVMNSRIPGYYHKDHCHRGEVMNALTRYSQRRKKDSLGDVIDIHEMQ